MQQQNAFVLVYRKNLSLSGYNIERLVHSLPHKITTQLTLTASHSQLGV